jgi:hypothetical protein
MMTTDDLESPEVFFENTSKKRKIESAAWDTKRQGAVITVMKTLLGDGTQLSYQRCPAYHSVTAENFSKRISTDALRASVEKCGAYLADVALGFAPLKTLELRIVDDKPVAKFLPVRFVRSGAGSQHLTIENKILEGIGTENTRHLQSIQHYAQTYLGAQTPVGVKVEFEKKETKYMFGGASVHFEVRIQGWSMCDLQQLESFRNMLRHHVQCVEFDAERVYVAVVEYSRPLTHVYETI